MPTTEIKAVENSAPPIMSNKKVGGRFAFIDWTRGIAATIMLQGHVFHSFDRNDLRDNGPYAISQFFGGIAPAVFLFLTGMTLAFLMDGLEKKGLSKWDRFTGGMRRAGYLGLLAALFRLQLWLFAWPYGNVNDLLKVDILNCMGLAMAVMAPLAIVTTVRRAKYALVAGILIAVGAPLVAVIPQGVLPPIVHMYLVPDYRYFAFFPWAAFIAFGVSAGSIIRLIDRSEMTRVMQWTGLVGVLVALAAQYFSNFAYTPYPVAVEYWLDSPAFIFAKLGVILMVLTVAYLWTQVNGVEKWSWVRQLGTTSLLVYWVHIELVYGRWFGFFKERLDNFGCATFAFFLILTMIGLSKASTHWNWSWKNIWNWLTTVAAPQPERVSGD